MVDLPSDIFSSSSFNSKKKSITSFTNAPCQASTAEDLKEFVSS
jgi:hypothetical protein